MAVYAKAKGEREKADFAKEMQLRAERRAGELLDKGPKAKGTLKQGDKLPQLHDATTGIPTYADLGIDRHMAFRWQLEASVPDEAFEEYLAKFRGDGKELTATRFWLAVASEGMYSGCT